MNEQVNIDAVVRNPVEQWWTVNETVEQPVRYVNQMASGGSFVAIFTLVVEPHAGSEQVLFANALLPDDPAQPYVPAIVEGLREFADHRAREFRPVVGVRVTLTAVRLHPVDCKRWAFQRAAVLGMTQAFADHGVSARPRPPGPSPSSGAGLRPLADPQHRARLIRSLGDLMSGIMAECYGEYYDGQWDYGDEYRVPELCRRAVAEDADQYWCSGRITPETGARLMAVATNLGHWVCRDDAGTGYMPFVPFPVPPEYAERIETHQAFQRATRPQR